MKLSTVIVTLMFIAASNQYEYLPKEESLKIKQTCIQQSGVDTDLVDKFGKGDISNDEKLKCYFKCNFILANRMDEAGNIEPKAFDKIVPSYVDLEKAEEVVAKCKDLKGANACETAFSIAKCMKETSAG